MNQQALQTLIPTSAINVGNFQFAAGAGNLNILSFFNQKCRTQVDDGKVNEVQAVHKPILCKRLSTHFYNLVSESQLTRRQVVIAPKPKLYAKVPITFLQ